MRWPRFWLMLGCLLAWGSTALPPHAAATLATGSEPKSHQFSAAHDAVARTDDLGGDRNDRLSDRVRPQHEVHLAPLWQRVSVTARDGWYERVVIPTPRHAAPPPLVGTVELLI